MNKSLLLLAFLLLALFHTAQAQTLSISYQNPDGFFVCSTDEFGVTLSNSGTPAATGVKTTLTLPAGITYLPGSVQGATEANIGNPNAPVFNIADVPGGGSRSFQVTLQASCDLQAAINSGQLFSNQIAVTHAGGNVQSTTQLYKVETALLLVTSVAPASLSGGQGDVLTRQITVRNTREGAIKSLNFTDLHGNGLSMTLEGIGGTNTSNTFFQATVPGLAFKNVGDGDELLENGEEITLFEKITVTRCTTASAVAPSALTVSWGCGNSVCQQDTASAQVIILPGDKNPDLVFIPKYNVATDQCGQTPAVQEMLIINQGLAATKSVGLVMQSFDTLRLGIDIGSFEVNMGSGWQPVAASGKPTALESCGLNFHKTASMTLPGLAEGDSMRLRFRTYYCAATCFREPAGFSGAFSYPKSCPETQFVGGVFNFFPTHTDTEVDASVQYDFGGCMAMEQDYPFTYWTKSERQLVDTGFFHVFLELPQGLEWSDCDAVMDGKTPVKKEVTVVPKTSTKVHLAYQLPFSADSVGMKFCLRFMCVDTPACGNLANFDIPPGTTLTVFPTPPGCAGCDLTAQAISGFASTPDAGPECIIAECDYFTVVGDLTHCKSIKKCNCKRRPNIILPTAFFDTYRANVGLQDDDDDRQADGPNLTASPKIRRDRFLFGDTMRVVLRSTVEKGTHQEAGFRFFHESWSSDFGLDGGDSYSLAVGKDLFTSSKALAYLDGTVRFFIAATGQQYTCPVDGPTIQSDKHLFNVADPNIRPEQPADEIISMYDEYYFNLPELSTTGCVPPDLRLSGGDSVVFVGHYRFLQNFVPSSGSSVPALINFRSVISSMDAPYAWKSDSSTAPLLRQYSGIHERSRTPSFDLLPCQNAEQTSPFFYEIRIARPNLFPYEVRPLSALTAFSHSLPGVVPVLDKRLTHLRLQEAMPLFTNVPLDPQNPVIDFGPYFAKPLDEGWNLQTDFTLGYDCDVRDHVPATTELQVKYASEIFKQPNPWTNLVTNEQGYAAAAPDLRLVPQDSLVYLLDKDFSLPFKIRNLKSAEAPHGWLVIEDGGVLADVQVLAMPSGQPVPQVGGVYQIGKFIGSEQKDFILKARSLACDVSTLTIRYGWDCSPVTNAASEVCRGNVRTVKIRPVEPELELLLKKQPSPLPFCEPSDYFEFEIYNANEGTARGLIASLKLPPGLSIVPNSAQYAYPSGSPWQTLPDPALVNGTYQWKPADVSTFLNLSGLKGVSAAPEHSISVRFKVEAGCGFVSNSQIVYGSEAVKPCGALSNVLRKPGSPVKLAGLEPSYTVQAQLGFTNPPGLAACGETVGLTATLFAGGTPSPSDSIYLLLPVGTSYVAGSYQAGANAPAGPPQVQGQTLRLPLSSGAGNIAFQFELRYDNPAGCDDKIVALQTREREAAYCPSKNVNCSVYVATGESLLTLNTQNPDLLLKDFEPVAAGNGFAFKALLENVGAGAAQNEVIRFYLDQNGNGKADPGEPLVQEAKLSEFITAGSAVPVSGPLSSEHLDLCKLIAVLPGADNCACADRTVLLGGNAVTTASLAACTVGPFSFGTQPLSGHTYTWTTPNGLSCTDCPTATFTPGPNVQPGDAFTFVLLDKSGNCTVEHRFEVKYGAPSTLEMPDQTICRGETTTLTAPAGGAYAWSGPGVLNIPTAHEQVLTPTATAQYQVTVTFIGGCTVTGEGLITVLPADTLRLPDRTTCKGSPLDVFGTLTDVAGIYTKKLANAAGCDSVLLQRLLVLPTNTTENVPLCPQAEILVFGEKVDKPGNFCKAFQNSLGCDSTHCVAVQAVSAPVLPTPDTTAIAKGEQVKLQGPANMTTYLWSPAATLTCNNCPDPFAKPDSSTSYVLKIRDGNGCEGGVTYRVLVFPPCDPVKNLLIPNAFTPNGDQVNDVFRVVPFEGFEEVFGLQIYDRWGRKVFEKTGSGAIQWDGTVDGKPGQSDVYVWIIAVDCPAKGRTTQKGDVTLLR